MAERTATRVVVGNAQVLTWAGLLQTDNGNAYEVLDYNDLCIQFFGTAGAALALKFQGSNDGTNWEDLTDLQGNAISKTGAAIEQVSEAPRYVRPLVTGGDGTTNMTAVLVARRARLI